MVAILIFYPVMAVLSPSQVVTLYPVQAVILFLCPIRAGGFSLSQAVPLCLSHQIKPQALVSMASDHERVRFLGLLCFGYFVNVVLLQEVRVWVASNRVAPLNS